ncbi:type IV conjugative transfer system pilin TraA, partial [Escherichia albertii]|uniref:type IV conjugative transfer system pilin TraA n=1 Tax=Escherichia albertii TaxID=208962 RepID=UPI0039BFD4F6
MDAVLSVQGASAPVKKKSFFSKFTRLNMLRLARAVIPAAVLMMFFPQLAMAVFVLISLLVNVRTSVQIIDNSDLVKVHRVDNVPVGLAMPLSLTTRIGHAMVAGYEMVFAQPDSAT